MSGRRYLPFPGLVLTIITPLALASCGTVDNCERICDWETDCYGVCDYIEEPACDQEQRTADYMRNCLEGCHGGTVDGSMCPGAEPWADCLDATVCGATPTSDCEIAEMRYHEVCLGTPGDWVCGYFCTELEDGCTAWEEFGYRGTDCVEKCTTAAQSAECREAIYDFDACTPGQRLACQLDDMSCGPQAEALITACDGWEPAVPNPTEDEACLTIATHQCDCGLRQPEVDCVQISANRCRFHLGLGQTCIDAVNDFDFCMAALQECDRDKLREDCLPEWDAWYAACLNG